MPKELPRHSYLLLLSILIAGNFSLYETMFAPHALTWKVLDVGEKGSATLVRAPSGATILIDAGPDASILRALGKELPPWQRKIDLVLLTSEKSSSAGGLPDVLGRYRVARHLTLTSSQRLTFGTDAYIDIEIRKNAPAGVFVSDGQAVTQLK